MFVKYFSAFAPRCDSVIKDDSYLSTVGNDASECSAGENTILSETGDESVTETCNIPTLDFGSSDDKSMTWFDLVVSMDSDGSIEYERMSSELGTAEGSVGVFNSEILMDLENRKLWQASGEPCDYDFYLYQQAFPGT